MASVSYVEELTCSLCLTFFTDPVTLACGHSFCRQCVAEALSTQQQCPLCRTAVPTDQSLQTSLILKSLAERAREAERSRTGWESERTEAAEELCPEHGEKLKLFCVTDQQLACIICRDGEKHEGHRFKPVKEAAASLKKELETSVQHVSDDVHAVDGLADAQRAEITKTKERSQQLETQIRRQFEEMHQFLRKREDEIKKELKCKELDAVETMSASLKAIETALTESRELQGKVTSVLKVTDPERFLKSWTEGTSTMSPEHLFRSRAKELRVVETSLSLGPYESHLQFFMWKEMLQVVQPRAEPLSLTSSSPDVIMSQDGRSLFCKPKNKQVTQSSPLGFANANNGARSLYSKCKNKPVTQSSPFSFDNAKSFSSAFGQQQSYAGSFSLYVQPTGQNTSNHTIQVFSVAKFTSGQHYWEIDVGKRDYWELGIESNFLKYDGQKYVTCQSNRPGELDFMDRPRKIGIYLDCSANELSFYDADAMTRIHTMRSIRLSNPVSPCFIIRYNEPDRNPVTVCWY